MQSRNDDPAVHTRNFYQRCCLLRGRRLSSRVSPTRKLKYVHQVFLQAVCPPHVRNTTGESLELVTFSGTIYHSSRRNVRSRHESRSLAMTTLLWRELLSRMSGGKLGFHTEFVPFDFLQDRLRRAVTGVGIGSTFEDSNRIFGLGFCCKLIYHNHLVHSSW